MSNLPDSITQRMLDEHYGRDEQGASDEAIMAKAMSVIADHLGFGTVCDAALKLAGDEMFHDDMGSIDLPRALALITAEVSKIIAEKQVTA